MESEHELIVPEARHPNNPTYAQRRGAQCGVMTDAVLWLRVENTQLFANHYVACLWHAASHAHRQPHNCVA